MIFINKKSFKLDEESKCENYYNIYKLEKSRKDKRQDFLSYH